MDRAIPPNASTLAASRLVENLAQPVADALEHIARELSLCGYPTKAPLASAPTATTPRTYDPDDYCHAVADDELVCCNPRPCSTHDTAVDLTPTEQGAAKAAWLRNQRDQIHDDVRAIALIAYSLADTVRAAAGTRLSMNPDKPRCWAGNLDGYHLARDQGGWSDPTCAEIPRAGLTGPCDKCYARHLRYRKRNNLPPLSTENRVSAA